MTPSQKAKYHGLRSLKQVMELTGDSRQTLSNWHKNKPERFETICIGAAYRIYGTAKL